MSRLVGTMHHPTTMQPVKIFEGFSFPCFFFGGLWYIAKGLWKWAAISIIASVLTWGISFIFFPFFANKHNIQNLIENGYLPDDSARTFLLMHSLITENYPTLEKSTSTSKRVSERSISEYPIPS
jgi:hypothetical protein